MLSHLKITLVLNINLMLNSKNIPSTQSMTITSTLDQLKMFRTKIRSLLRSLDLIRICSFKILNMPLRSDWTLRHLTQSSSKTMLLMLKTLQSKTGVKFTIQATTKSKQKRVSSSTKVLCLKMPRCKLNKHRFISIYRNNSTVVSTKTSKSQLRRC